MCRVVPYVLRTEGGERLNGPHGDFWEEKTTRFSPTLHQRGIPGPPGVPWVPQPHAAAHSGIDTLVEAGVADWWVAQNRLLGGWPTW